MNFKLLKEGLMPFRVLDAQGVPDQACVQSLLKSVNDEIEETNRRWDEFTLLCQLQAYF